MQMDPIVICATGKQNVNIFGWSELGLSIKGVNTIRQQSWLFFDEALTPFCNLSLGSGTCIAKTVWNVWNVMMFLRCIWYGPGIYGDKEKVIMWNDRNWRTRDPIALLIQYLHELIRRNCAQTKTVDYFRACVSSLPVLLILAVTWTA